MTLALRNVSWEGRLRHEALACYDDDKLVGRLDYLGYDEGYLVSGNYPGGPRHLGAGYRRIEDALGALEGWWLAVRERPLPLHGCTVAEHDCYRGNTAAA